MARGVQARVADAAKETRWSAQATKPAPRTAEEDRRAHREAHAPRNGGEGGIPVRYSRITPPPAAERTRPARHHGDIRGALPKGEAVDLPTMPLQGIRQDQQPKYTRGRQMENTGDGASRGQGRGGSSGGGEEIASMREDWPAMNARVAQSGEEFLAALKARVAAVGDAPVHSSAKEAAEEYVGQVEKALQHWPDIDAATRAADEPLWDAHVDAPRPNHQAWGN